jgi:ABC-type transport system involved in multi-copper enzyme maturation permease subunit
MPAPIEWFLSLLLTNPICVRLIQGGSTRIRHLYLRSGYLAILIASLLLALLGPAASLRELAQRGASAFTIVAFGQVLLICLLTPVFMAGAIAQEANPRTWDILLTTPLNSMQIVLGNLFGRLFFILALLFSSLPLFLFIQSFGGVPGESIVLSYFVAGCSALVVASVAVTLSVTRTAGRRAVFAFYVSVVVYLFLTWLIDNRLRAPVSVGSLASATTIMTPLNPFLALESLLLSNSYVPLESDGDGSVLRRWWLGSPVSAFVWSSILLSVLLVAYSTLRLRVIGAKTGQTPWYRTMLRLGGAEGEGRAPRVPSQNPIAWRETSSRTLSLAGVIGRWGFIAAGALATLVSLWIFHVGAMTIMDLRVTLLAIVAAEITIVVLAAVNMSATAVSREREDGTLDLILTTPIQPGPYIAGKLRGLIQYLLPMLVVPVVCMLIAWIYAMARPEATIAVVSVGTASVSVPLLNWGAVFGMSLLMPTFVAFTVMVGLQWSIRSKGTIGSVVAAVMVVFAVTGVIGLCGFASGNGIPFLGSAVSAISPFNLVGAAFLPEATISETVREGDVGGLSMLIGAAVAAVLYGFIVFGMHASMKRSFMMTVRRLAGTR